MAGPEVIRRSAGLLVQTSESNIKPMNTAASRLKVRTALALARALLPAAISPGCRACEPTGTDAGRRQFWAQRANFSCGEVTV